MWPHHHWADETWGWEQTRPPYPPLHPAQLKLTPHLLTPSLHHFRCTTSTHINRLWKRQARIRRRGWWQWWVPWDSEKREPYELMWSRKGLGLEAGGEKMRVFVQTKGNVSPLQSSVPRPHPWSEECLVFTWKPSPSVSVDLTTVLCSGFTAALKKSSVGMRRGAESGQRITVCPRGDIHHCFVLRPGKPRPPSEPRHLQQAMTEHL